MVDYAFQPDYTPITPPDGRCGKGNDNLAKMDKWNVPTATPIPPVKNGQRKGRQCYKCKQCGRQFLEYYRPWKYSDEVKQLCIKMYLNGMGLRGIERVTDIYHTTVMGWVKEAGLNLPDVPETDEEPEITDLDELQTFVGNKRHKV